MFWKKKKKEPNPLVGRVYEYYRGSELYFAHVTHIIDNLVVYDTYDDGLIAVKGRIRSADNFDCFYDTSTVECLFKNVKEHFEEAATRAEMEDKIKKLENRVDQLKQDKEFLEGKVTSTEME